MSKRILITAIMSGSFALALTLMPPEGDWRWPACVAAWVVFAVSAVWCICDLLKEKPSPDPPAKADGYSTLQLIAQKYQNRPPQPRPELQARIISVGIRGIAGGTGITVYMRIDNLGTPSCADHFVANVKASGATHELFPAELPAKATFADEGGEIQDITRSDTLYEILRNPIVEGGHALGFLFYFAKDVSPAELTAGNPPEITIRFRDVRRREYVVTSEGQEPSYPPNVRDPFVALARKEKPGIGLSGTLDAELIKKPTSLNAKIERVTFHDRSDAQKPYLILTVLLLVENTGAPTAASGWRLTFKSAGLNLADFKAAGRQTDRDLGRGIILYRKDSLIEKLELNTLSPGTPIRGWLDYYFEDKKLSDLLGKPFEMEIAFRDTFGREGTAKFSAVVQDTGGPAAYFPGAESSPSRAEESDKAIKAFVEMEALPISAWTENQTQLGNIMRGGPVFRGKCIFSIRNPNPTHGFTGIGCRLISIDPPFRSAAGYRAMTENYTLRRVKFSIDDIEDNKLRGNQTAHVHILTAERKPFAEPKSLKNITINIEGKWPEESANEFTPPKSEHIVTLEVFGDGLQTKQERFKPSFSEEFKDDVFTITKLPS